MVKSVIKKYENRVALAVINVERHLEVPVMDVDDVTVVAAETAFEGARQVHRRLGGEVEVVAVPVVAHRHRRECRFHHRQ